MELKNQDLRLTIGKEVKQQEEGSNPLFEKFETLKLEDFIDKAGCESTPLLLELINFYITTKGLTYGSTMVLFAFRLLTDNGTEHVSITHYQLSCLTRMSLSATKKAVKDLLSLGYLSEVLKKSPVTERVNHRNKIYKLNKGKVFASKYGLTVGLEEIKKIIRKEYTELNLTLTTLSSDVLQGYQDKTMYVNGEYVGKPQRKR